MVSRRRSEPTSSMVRPSPSSETTQALVSWSSASTTAATPNRSAHRPWRGGGEIGRRGRGRRRPRERRPRGRHAPARPCRSPEAEAPALALHAQRSVRQGLEAFLGDVGAALLALAVGAGVDLLDRGVDLLDGGAGLRRQGQVALALDGQRVALARLLVELDVAGLAVLGQRVGLGLQGLGLAQVVGALGSSSASWPSRNLSSVTFFLAPVAFLAGAAFLAADFTGASLVALGMSSRRPRGKGCRMVRRPVRPVKESVQARGSRADSTAGVAPLWFGPLTWWFSASGAARGMP